MDILNVMNGPFTFDLVALSASVAMLVLYHLYLARKQKRNPAYTVQAVNIIARTAWVENIMHGGKDILAVQTLRNSTMAATFLASTSVLLIIGVLSLSGQADKLENTWHVLNLLGARHSELYMAKLLFLLVDMVFAFFAFSMSIRIFNHVGFMINVPLAANHKAISPTHVAIHLNRAGRFYSLGMRAYYFAVPLLFWLFGPLFMLISTAGLITILYRLDRAPKVMVDDYRS